MRTKLDAIRSLQKYLSQVLAPNPPLASIRFGGTAWTTRGQVQGAVDVDAATWRWLRSLDRHAPEPVGSPAAPASYYLESELSSDPAPRAAAAHVTLPSSPAVQRFALEVEPQWEVRLWYDRGELPTEGPFARVYFVGAGPTSGPALYFDVTQPMTIECYPFGVATPDTVRESVLRATKVEDLLLAAFRGPGIGAGRPRRIPMWDFDGVAATETTEERGSSDYMKLLDFSTRQLPNPEDPRDVAVIADLRLSWRVEGYERDLRDRQGQPTRGTRVVSAVHLDEELG